MTSLSHADRRQDRGRNSYQLLSPKSQKDLNDLYSVVQLLAKLSNQFMSSSLSTTGYNSSEALLRKCLRKSSRTSSKLARSLNNKFGTLQELRCNYADRVVESVLKFWEAEANNEWRLHFEQQEKLQRLKRSRELEKKEEENPFGKN